MSEPTQAIFLTSALGGVVSIVAAIGVARLYWRTDIAPFGRHTNSIKVLSRPAFYARPVALGAIRALTHIGYTFFAVAVSCLIYQFLADFVRHG
jgi:hypothetical protein